MSIYILSDKRREYFRGYDNVVNCWQKWSYFSSSFADNYYE